MSLRTKLILKLAEKHAVDVDCEEADPHEDTTTDDLEELEFYHLSFEGPGYVEVDPDQLMNINNNNNVVQPPVDHTECRDLAEFGNIQAVLMIDHESASLAAPYLIFNNDVEDKNVDYNVLSNTDQNCFDYRIEEQRNDVTGQVELENEDANENQVVKITITTI
ncbi:hypothetical protein QE152_g35142 [Popillia japonica]|uniref:Uncharacterized protein n=1 Tax=Popillia japonica TaxID=7064 RepID=A0AAW1IR37_POPJA